MKTQTTYSANVAVPHQLGSRDWSIAVSRTVTRLGVKGQRLDSETEVIGELHDLGLAALEALQNEITNTLMYLARAADESKLD